MRTTFRTVKFGFPEKIQNTLSFIHSFACQLCHLLTEAMSFIDRIFRDGLAAPTIEYRVKAANIPALTAAQPHGGYVLPHWCVALC